MHLNFIIIIEYRLWVKRPVGSNFRTPKWLKEKAFFKQVKGGSDRTENLGRHLVFNVFFFQNGRSHSILQVNENKTLFNKKILAYLVIFFTWGAVSLTITRDPRDPEVIFHSASRPEFLRRNAKKKTQYQIGSLDSFLLVILLFPPYFFPFRFRIFGWFMKNCQRGATSMSHCWNGVQEMMILLST